MHFVWMDRGYAFLKGMPLDLPPGFVKSDDLCPIGNWLRDRLAPHYRSGPLFARTSSLHEEFHVVLDVLFSQKIAEVPRPIVARFHQVGNDLTAALKEWIMLASSAAQT